jgi:hypothetical protein
MKKPSTKTVCRRGKLPDGQLIVGLDLGDRPSFYCVLNGAREVILEERVATGPEAMKKTFEKMPASRIALETGTHSPWVSRLLTELGPEASSQSPEHPLRCSRRISKAIPPRSCGRLKPQITATILCPLIFLTKLFAVGRSGSSAH